jgi:hypothetical protein
VIVPAGGIAVFSGVAFHRSGTNKTSRWRRVYLAQYSSAICKMRDGNGNLGNPMPFLKDGQRSSPPAPLHQNGD